MSLKSEISINYEDANGLVSPKRCLNSDVNASGNGVCYTGELVTLLALRSELDSRDSAYFFAVMSACMKVPGLLSRGPLQPDQNSVDDYYGFAAGCVATNNTHLASKVIDYGWANTGSYNNVTPGVWTLKSFLWRQPQLICALYAAARRTPLWIYPLRVYTALVIATSCMRAHPLDADARRINWLLIQAMRGSLICRLAAKIWFNRLYVDYPKGMQDVALMYYEQDPEHPFIKYFPLEHK